MKTLLTPLCLTLLLILGGLAHAEQSIKFTDKLGNKRTMTAPDGASQTDIQRNINIYNNSLETPEEKAEAAQKKRSHGYEWCTKRAGKMNNEFAAKKLYESCLAEKGLEPESKAWYEW